MLPLVATASFVIPPTPACRGGICSSADRSWKRGIHAQTQWSSRASRLAVAELEINENMLFPA
jgi:hypothetical protein